MTDLYEGTHVALVKFRRLAQISVACAERGSHVRTCSSSGSPGSHSTSNCTDNTLVVAHPGFRSSSRHCSAAVAACSVSVRTICRCCEDRCARAQRSRHAKPSASGSCQALEVLVHSPCGQRLCGRDTARGAPASFPFPTPRNPLGLGHHGTVGASNFSVTTCRV